MKEPINVEIFVIDDDKSTTDVIAVIFDQNGITNYRLFNRSEDLLAALTDDVHICIVDYKLKNDINGLDLIKKIVKKNRHCWFIMLSGQEDKSVIIDYMNSVYGSRYIEKAGTLPLNFSIIFHINEIISQIKFVDEFYSNVKRIENGFNDLKNLLTA